MQARIAASQATPEEQQLFTRLSAEVAEVHRMIAVRDRVRLDPSAEATLGGSDRELYTRAQAELPGWTGREQGTSIHAMSMTGENGQAAISGSANLSGGQVSTHVANAHLEGVDQGGRHIDSIDAHGVNVGAQVNGDLRSGAQPAGPEQSLTSRLASANFDAERLEMAGYHATGQSLSATLAAEQRQIAQAVELGQATDAQRARLGELPALLEEARRAEARLTELRTQQGAPGGLNREQTAEMQALAARCDPHTMTIQSVHATEVHASMSQQGGLDLNVGHAGSGQAGLTMEGFRQGTVGPNGQETTTRSIDHMSAESMQVTASANGGLAGLADSANLGSDQSGLHAGVRGTGLEMQGFTQGQQGQSGYQHVNAIHARGFGVDYNQANGGTAQVNLEGASAEGVTRQSSRLDSLDQAIAQYTAQESSGRPLSPEQQAHVAELRAERHRYEDLQAQLTRARSASQRRNIQSQITQWERVAEQRIASVGATRVNAQVTGVGNVMDDHWNMSDQNLGVRAHVDQLNVGRVTNVDERGREQQQVGSASATNVDVTGRNVMGANGQASNIHATVGEFDARGVRGGANVGHAHGRGLTADVNTQVDARHGGRRTMNASGSLQSGNVSGVYAGGASVGGASVSGANFNVTNVGERDQHAGLSARSASASGVHYAGNGTTADIHDVRGGGLNVSSGGGNMSAGMRSFSGHGVTYAGSAADGATTNADVSEFHGEGASFSAGGGRTNASVNHVAGTNANYTGVAGNTPVSVPVNDAQGNQIGERAGSAQGSTTVGHVDTFDATGVRYGQGGGVTTVGVGSARVTGVSGGQQRYLDGQYQGSREGGANSASVTNANATINGNNITADVGSANVAGGHFVESNAQGQEVRSGSTGPQGVTVNGLHAEANTQTGNTTAEWRTITGDQLTFRDNTNPQQRVDVVLNQLQIGSADQVSVLHWDGNRVAGAQISQMIVGANSHAYIGPNADQHHDQSYASPQGDNTHRIEMTGGVHMENIRIQNLNPGNISEAGTSVRIGSAGATNFMYSGNGNTLVVDNATAQRLYVAGQGNGQMMAGVGHADGSMRLTSTTNVLDATGHQTGRTRQEETFGGQNVYVDNAYAVLQQNQQGSWDVVRAHVEAAGGDNLHIRVRPEGVPEGQQAQAPTLDGHQDMDMSALAHMNGSVALDIDMAGLLAGHPDAASIARRFPHLNLNIPITDGHFTVASMTIALGQHGISGRTAAVIAGYIAGHMSGVPGGSLVGAVAAGAGASYPISAQSVAEMGAGHVANSTDAPAPAGYKNGINMQVHMQNIGGHIQYGTAFSGDVQNGGTVDVHGNMGQNLNVGANMDINNASVGANTGIDRIHTGNAQVQITDNATGQSTLDVNVRGGRVEGVNYSSTAPGNGQRPGENAQDRARAAAAQADQPELPEVTRARERGQQPQVAAGH